MQVEHVMDETSEPVLLSAYAAPESAAPAEPARRRRLLAPGGAERGTRSLWVFGEAIKIVRAAREWAQFGLEPGLWAEHEPGGDLDTPERDEHNARELWHVRRTTLAFSALTVGAVTGACSARGVIRLAFAVLALPPAAVAAWTGTFTYLIDVHQRISRANRHRPR